MKKTNAVLLKEVRAALKAQETLNESMAEQLATMREENADLKRASATRIADDATRAFRTVEIKVFNEKGKQSSGQFFGVGQGNHMTFHVDENGAIGSYSGKPKPVTT